MYNCTSHELVHKEVCMSQLTGKDIVSIANISRLGLSDEEIDILTGHINTLLENAQEMIAINTDGVEPTTQIITSAVNGFRRDEILPSFTAQQATANGPQVAENCFVVPRVVDT